MKEVRLLSKDEVVQQKSHPGSLCLPQQAGRLLPSPIWKLVG